VDAIKVYSNFHSNQHNKMLVFCAYNTIPSTDLVGMLLLRVLRAFAVVDMYLSFEVHTTQTINAGRAALKKFAQLMTVRACV
jgi:hypothetical protein